MTTQRGFRFGVNMVVPQSRTEWVDKCRRAEALGYDVIGVADHLGMAPPFPALVLAAESTEHVRLNTFVLNAAFYNPVLLARDAAGTDQFIDGRLELGLGAGYVRDEFVAAGIPFGTGGQRVSHLERTVGKLRDLFADPNYQPAPAQAGGPPLLIAGWGDRLLQLAAEHAAVVGFTGAAATAEGGLRLVGPEEIDERVAYVRRQLGERIGEVELNILVQAVVPESERADLLARYETALPAEVVAGAAELPTVLVGSPQYIAQRLCEYRERFGISYITVLEDRMEIFAPVIEQLR